jgi:hypothetical protein
LEAVVSCYDEHDGAPEGFWYDAERQWTDNIRAAVDDFRRAIEAAEQGHGSLVDVEAARTRAEFLLGSRSQWNASDRDDDE